jgi:hypothetical protein
MNAGQHDDHDRPGIADMRAALLATRAILDRADDTAHQAAEGGSCPACTAVAAASLGITLASTLAGDTAFVSEPVRGALLAAVDAAERELGSAAN